MGLPHGSVSTTKGHPDPARGVKAQLSRLMSGSRFALLLYAAGILASATLLFLVQPMIAKMILPYFGGSPAVWTTSLAFFQVLLVLGYAYSHLIATRLNSRHQVLLHAVVLVAPLLLLPARVTAASAPATGSEVGALLLALCMSVGLPFFVLSTTSSLVQHWFARDLGGDPSFLYAASNVGSLSALLLYPFVMEPLMGLPAQSKLWTLGYVVYALLLFGMMWRTLQVADAASAPAGAGPHGRARKHSAPTIERATEAGPSLRDIFCWAALAGVASWLLSAVSLELSLDVGSAPLLWVVPLAIYLVTFVLAFWPGAPLHRHRYLAGTLGVVALVAFSLAGALPLPVRLLLSMGGLFLCCCSLHCLLAQRRPTPQHLTSYYLWISIGGALGSVFCNLVAPLVFERNLEYPIGIALFFLLQLWFVASDPSSRAAAAFRHGHVRAWYLLYALWACIAPFLGPNRWIFSILALLHGVTLRFRVRPPLQAIALSLFVLLMATVVKGQQAVETRRSFFGVVQISQNRETRVMLHGTTRHGAESLQHPGAPTAYYHPTAPMSTLVATAPPTARIAVAGLGAGSIAGLLQPGQNATFFEIDPIVEPLARKWFTYLDKTRGKASVVLGDARIGLSHTDQGPFDLFILDAFSSDAIPMHLLSEDALATYLKQLVPDGVIAFHISNRHLDLLPVMRGLSRAAQLSAVVNHHFPDAQAKAEGALPSTVVAMARSPDLLKRLGAGWKPLDPTGRSVLWTDDQSSILDVIAR